MYGGRWYFYVGTKIGATMAIKKTPQSRQVYIL